MTKNENYSDNTNTKRKINISQLLANLRIAAMAAKTLEAHIMEMESDLVEAMGVDFVDVVW